MRHSRGFVLTRGGSLVFRFGAERACGPRRPTTPCSAACWLIVFGGLFVLEYLGRRASLSSCCGRMVSGWLVPLFSAAAASGFLQALWPVLAIGSSGLAEFFAVLLFLLASAVFVVFGYFFLFSANFDICFG